jgi:hypothetical protein
LFWRAVEHPRLIVHVTPDTSEAVGAINDELLVLRSARERSPKLDAALKDIAGPAPTGTLAAGRASSGDDAERAVSEDELLGPAGVELWRLRDEEPNAIDASLRLRDLADTVRFPAAHADGSQVTLEVPPVTPNHICVVSIGNGWCPAGAPRSTLPPDAIASGFVEEPLPGYYRPRVVVIDTGYIKTHPPNAALDGHVTSVAGYWFDSHGLTWRISPPDEPDSDHDGWLDEVSGHGTFVAGQVAHQCRQARITVVGQRHEVVPLGKLASPADQARLFTTEFSLAQAMLDHADTDVLHCGFAFPTLTFLPSSAFAAVMNFLGSPAAPRPGVAVVCPAGNEGSSNPYWPAAHPYAIGVAATNARQTAPTDFSNWGPWLKCAARGEYVLSTHLDWIGPVRGNLTEDIEEFRGWARWDGTSFAAPKVSGQVAQVLVDTASPVTLVPSLTPVQAAIALIAGTAGVPVNNLLGLGSTQLPAVLLG